MKSPLPSPKEFEILKLLRAHTNDLIVGGLYGLEIVRNSKGAVKKGSVYVLLNLLIEKKLVSSEDMDDPYKVGTPRKRYRITDMGWTVCDLWYELEK